MPNSKDALKERLARYRQIKISVVGTKFRRTNQPDLQDDGSEARRLAHAC